jgi:zinc/manganese transport system ATP-binding protein
LTAIALDGVSLSIGGKAILSDTSLDVGDGEFIGVLGANGSGKTTLMKAILGLLPLQKGTIRVHGKPVTRGNPAIGYLPQVQAIGTGVGLTGRDFLSTSVRGHRWGLPFVTATDRAEIDACLDRVDGVHLAERQISELSGGERQRLLIAEALIGAPRVLILDEPLTSLDPHQQWVIVDLVNGLVRNLGLAVLLSAHELNQVLGAVDRVLYLGHGHAAIGSVDEVVDPVVLSRLYDAPIDVVRAAGHIFVMSGGQVIERDRHHDHGL